MIDLFVLEQFAAFAEYGTLSEAAEKLHLTQPSLSRSMKKLEEDLGVALFDRQKNHIALNENGKYLYELSRLLLADAQTLEERIRDFDRKHKTLSVGLCAPAPAWILTPLLSGLYSQMTLQTRIEDESKLLASLTEHQYQLIVTYEAPASDDVFSRPLITEQLKFALPQGHRFASRESLSFKEMDGENMLLMSDIGFWAELHHKKMPSSRFLIQNDRATFNELVRASILPSFVTNLSEKYMDSGKGRIHVPVSDPEACVTYYLVCMKEARKDFRAVFGSL